MNDQQTKKPCTCSPQCRCGDKCACTPGNCKCAQPTPKAGS